MKFVSVITIIATSLAVVSAALPVAPPVFNNEFSNQQVMSDKRQPIGKSYIVVFKESALPSILEKAEQDILNLGGKIGNRYTSALKGFSAWIPEPIVAALSTNPFIDYIEEDGAVYAIVD